MTANNGPGDINSQCSPTLTDFLKEKMGLCKMAFAEVAPKGTPGLNSTIINTSEEYKEKIANSPLAKGTGLDDLHDKVQSRQARYDAIFKDGPS